MKGFFPMSGAVRAGASSSSSSSAVVNPGPEENREILESTLRSIRDLLLDDNKNIDTMHLIKALKQLAYDADDVLAYYQYEVSKEQAEEVGMPPSVPEEIAMKTAMIVEKFEDISRTWVLLSVKQSGLKNTIEWHRPSRTTHKHRIFGRETDVENVVKMLLTDRTSSTEDHLFIVPIVGSGGIGKTTLAKLVYNDHRIHQHFDIRGWASMSKGIDILTVTKELLVSFSKKYLECSDPSVFEDKITEEILGKRFLIVLDDVSFVEKGFWGSLLSRLVSARSGKILITTCSPPSITGIQIVRPYELSCLSTQDSFSLFKEFHPIIDQLPNLSKFARSIVEKCAGVPLSVKVLGGVLSFRKNENVWSEVLDSDLWVHLQSSGFDSALMVGFDCMPSYLKQCFAFFSLFPNQYVFSKDDMGLLWMSLNHFFPQGSILPEKIVNSYFDDLVSASIIQNSDADGGIKGGFVIHNLLYDLAQTVCGQEFLKLDDEMSQISGDVRYLSIIGDNLGNTIDLQQLQQLKDLRMLQIINRRSKFDQVKTIFIPTAECFKHLRVLIFNNIHMDELPILIGNLRQLSYLSLRNTGTKNIPKSVFHLYNLLYLDLMGCPIRELPNSIGNLKQLRSLNIRNTCIKFLPESVGLLQKLVILDLMDCDIRELPEGIVQLINLEQVKLNWWRSLCMPFGIRQLTKLVKLARFEIRKGDWHCKISDLAGLINLKGNLCIAGLRNVTSIREVELANLKDKPHLRALRLELSSELCEINNHCNTIGGPTHLKNADFMKFDIEVLESLRPHTDLEYLQITGYGGHRLPSWLSDVSFSKLSKIVLVGREEGCEYLLALGMLPNLRILSISSFWSVQSVQREFCSLDSVVKGFQSLKTLVFDDMIKWMEWSGIQAGEFCSLELLKVLDCPELRSLPEQLSSSSFTKLLVKDCSMLGKLPNLPFLSVLVLKGQLNLDIFTCLDLPLLRTMKICCSSNIRSLLLNHEKLVQLKVLIVHACRNLRNLAGLGDLKALKIIKISQCENMQFSLNEKLPVSLERIDISDCTKLQKWKQICKNKYFEQVYSFNLVCTKIFYITI